MTRYSKILFFVTLIGVILRLFVLPKKDFWFDEAYTYHIARLPIPELFGAILADNNPPFYYLVIHFILRISENEIALRLPSLFFGVLTIPLIFVVFKNLVGRNPALWTAAFFSFSPLANYTSTEARFHSLAALLGISMVGSFFALIRTSKPANVLVFLTVAILGIYTQYYLVLLLISFSWVVVRQKNSLGVKKWLSILSIVFLALTPWIFRWLQTPHTKCFCPPTPLSLVASLVSPSINGVGDIGLRSFLGLSSEVKLLFITTVIISLIFFIKGLTKKSKILSIYLIPLFILSVLGLFLPVFSAKAFASFSPFFFAVVTQGFSKTKIQKRLGILLTILLLITTIIQITSPFFVSQKLKLVTKLILQNPSIIIAHTSFFTYYPLIFYNQSGQNNILITENPLSSSIQKYIGGEKKIISKEESEVWLVDSNIGVDLKEKNKVFSGLFENYVIVSSYQIHDIQLIHLRIKK